MYMYLKTKYCFTNVFVLFHIVMMCLYTLQNKIIIIMIISVRAGTGAECAGGWSGGSNLMEAVFDWK